MSINGPWNDSDPFVTADGLTIYFETDRDTNGNNIGNIYAATRSSTGSTFAAPSPVSAVNSLPDDDIDPAIDADGSLWFASNRTAGVGLDLFRAQAVAGGFNSPVPVSELESASDDWSPTPSADGLTVYFASARPGGLGANDIYVATRASLSSPFSSPKGVTELNTSEDDLPHWLSPDGCRIYLEQQHSSTYELYVATRPK